uniref:USP domain-containing protein n=2 Tax=Astyanax mexicanus TaxID=7994 RepID=A0A8B9JRI9_ASTMX
MGFFSCLKKRKKPKEVVKNDLVDEIKDTKEKKKKRRWWQRGFMKIFCPCLSSSTSSSSLSSPTFSSPSSSPTSSLFSISPFSSLSLSSPTSSSSSSSSSSSYFPTSPSYDHSPALPLPAPPYTYTIPTLGVARLAPPQRYFFSPAIRSSTCPPPLIRSSSAPTLTHPSSTYFPLFSPSLSISLPDLSKYYPDSPKAQRSRPRVLINSYVRSKGVYDRELSVLKRRPAHTSIQEVQDRSVVDVKQLGLPSIVNTCFMNATLQSLLGLSCFWTPIIEQQDTWSDTSVDSTMLRCLAELQQARFSSSSTTKQKMKILRALKRCLAARCPDFKHYSQQDAHEFLMLCLLQLKGEGEALRASNLSYVCPVANFEFQLKSVLTCTSCGLQRSRVEIYNHLSINLDSTLRGSLRSYFQETDLDYYCECELGIQATEAQEFATLPRVLILHIKRFKLMGSGKKLKGAMDIPAQLDLSEFSAQASPEQTGTKKCTAKSVRKSSVKPASGGGQDEGGQQRNSSERPPRGLYRLHSIVSHLGCSVNKGHYISNIVQDGESWLSFDDTRVHHVLGKTVLKCTATTAYLLFYVHSAPTDLDCDKREET